jgi:hypothetical protein
VLNTTLIRNSVQIMIFVNVSPIWNMLYIKDAFRNVSNKKWSICYRFVSFSHLITLLAYLCSQWTPNVLIKYFYFCLVDPQSIWPKLGLETCLPPNNDIRIYLRGMRHSWTKYAFWDVNNTNWCKCCNIV